MAIGRQKMKRPLSVLFVTLAILLGQAGAIDLDIYYPIDGNATGSGAYLPAAGEPDDPCLGAGSLERNDRAETIFAFSGFGIL